MTGTPGIAVCVPLRLHRATAHVPLSTVASFRTWQSSEIPIAWCAAFNAFDRSRFGNANPVLSAWIPVSGFRATGHRCLPILYGRKSIPDGPAAVNLRQDVPYSSFVSAMDNCCVCAAEIVTSVDQGR